MAVVVRGICVLLLLLFNICVIGVIGLSLD